MNCWTPAFLMRIMNSISIWHVAFSSHILVPEAFYRTKILHAEITKPNMLGAQAIVEHPTGSSIAVKSNRQHLWRLDNES